LRRPRTFLRLLAIIAGVYIAWCGLLFTVQDSLVYLPGLAGKPLPDRLIPAGVQRVWVEPEGAVRVEGWLWVPPGGPAPLVVLMHGNAELIDHCTDNAEAWLRRGYAVLLPEYRGYGRSGGNPGQDAILADVLAMLALAREHPGVASGPIVLHGRSLGTGIAAQVAARLQESPRAMVLESPFTSIASFAWKYGVPPALVRNPYRTDQVLPTLTCPILILHSRHDEVVPFAHGERLASLNPGARLVELSGSHNAGLSLQPGYWRAIDEFLSGP